MLLKIGRYICLFFSLEWFYAFTRDFGKYNIFNPRREAKEEDMAKYDIISTL